MKIVNVTRLSTEETLQRFAQTRLRGHGQPLIYADATLTLERDVDPMTLVPTQAYVLSSDLDRIKTLEALFRTQIGIDIFALEGTILFQLETDDGAMTDPIPFAPPIVEESFEAVGKIPLINDGMHRIAAAMGMGRTINIIKATGVPGQWPYYAYPLQRGWSDVELYDVRPEVKKTYRDPENYKALFRDFNAVFDGIQRDRSLPMAAVV